MRSQDPAGEAARIQRERYLVLEDIYRRTLDNMSMKVNLEWVASDLNMDLTRVQTIAQYLYARQLVELEQGGGGIFITHAGIYEVEQALTRPERETQYFPPNVITVHSMTHSVIQQGTHGSTVELTVGTAEVAKIGELVAEIRDGIGSLNLSQDQTAELRAELDGITAQLRSPKPKRAVLRELLSSVHALMIGITQSIPMRAGIRCW